MEYLFPVETPPPQQNNNVETGQHLKTSVSLLSCPSPDNSNIPASQSTIPTQSKAQMQQNVRAGLVLPDASIKGSGRLQAGYEIAAEVGHESESIHTLLVF